MLGVGAGDRPTAELGYSPARLETLRAMIGLVRGLMAGETLTESEGPFRMADAHLHYRQRERVPLYMACSGPRMLALAGELADGVIIQCGLFPAAIEFARQHLAEGAQRAGRSLEDLEIWVMMCGAISEDGDSAIRSSRTMAAWFAQTAPHCCALAGLDPALLKRIQAAYSGGEFHHAQAAAQLVPPEMVELFTLGGTPAAARARVEGLMACGLKAFNYMPTGGERATSLSLFAQHILAPLAGAGRQTAAATAR
jgi:5,10-methylenetetrahydromethanopterin reductase